MPGVVGLTQTGRARWVQRRRWCGSGWRTTTSAGTSVTINDTAPDFDRWNLAAVEIVAR